MQQKKDLLKLGIWVCSGILAVAVITIGIQHIMSPARQDTLPAQASVDTEKSVSSEESDAATAPAASTPVAKAYSANESPYPLSTALEVLNNGASQASEQTSEQTGGLAPGTSYSETSSGYPIYTGGRAVDSSSAPIVTQEPPGDSQNQVISTEQNQSTQAVGRNGLLSNPCVDPISVHGLAYSRHYN